MADIGFKISQDGFDVKTCDDKDLVMSSKFNMLKTAKVGQVYGGSPQDHNLSYTPIFFSIPVQVTGTQAGRCGFAGNDVTACNATQIKTVNPSGYAKYYIFYQPF